MSVHALAVRLGSILDLSVIDEAEEEAVEPVVADLQVGGASAGFQLGQPPGSWQAFEKFEIYWEVFDPYELDQPVAGSLSDDLLDVYRDVRGGLALWESRHDADAIWEWRFSFESHWGDHAVDALRALHRSCGRDDRGGCQRA